MSERPLTGHVGIVVIKALYCRTVLTELIVISIQTVDIFRICIWKFSAEILFTAK